MSEAKKSREVQIENTVECSEEYGVTTLRTSGSERYIHQKTPCAQCPWRMDVPTGVFPAKAFRTSAPTSYDASMRTFSCHMAGFAASTCAGFLLRHSDHNVAVRISQATGRIDLKQLSDGGFPIYRSYREMAVANGVDPEDPVLAECRGNDDKHHMESRNAPSRGHS